MSIDVAAFDSILATRRTVGAYRPDPVDPQLVQECLQLACWAPNHRKTEPWRFADIGPETKDKIIRLNSRIIAEKSGDEAAENRRKQWAAIPGWIAVSCVVDRDAFTAEEDYAACCCAIQNLMLAFWARGIATKWSTGDVTRHPEFNAIVGMPESGERIVGLIWYGYPQVTPQQTRRPLADVVRRLA